jgi:hypothetical protein
MVAAPSPRRHGILVRPQAGTCGSCGAFSGGKRRVDRPTLVVPRKPTPDQRLVDLDAIHANAREQPAVLVLASADDGHVFAEDQL